ncbi:MAG: ABC transporter permease [Bacillota bacterium]|nr:ABC transporter permease [Bacillota bacterium]
MTRYLLRRLGLSLLVLLGLTLVTFLLARLAPGDPAARWAGPHATVQQIEEARRELGLDEPLPVQYQRYMGRLLHGDWGVSIRTRQPVLQDLKRFLPPSLELVVAGMGLAILVGIPVGVLSAARAGRAVDHGSRLLAIAGVSLPTFWLAMILQLIFFQKLHWFPLAGELDSWTAIQHPVVDRTGFLILDSLWQGNMPALVDALRHLFLPALTLAAYPLGLTVRMVRSSMLDTLQEDHVRAARAAGFPEGWILFRYALKNALAPTLTVLALTFAYSLTGTFLVESVFNWPGLGQYAAAAVLTNDYPAIVGVTLVVAALYVSLNLLVDVIHAFMDPRVRVAMSS